MYESGDYVVPRIQDRPRLNKPPIIYWLQCGSIALFGDQEGQYPNANIWVFRFPSLLCAIVTVFLTWRLGLRLMDPRAALLGAALLAVCPMVVWDAHQARADQLLLATTTATMFALYVIWRNGRRAGAKRALLAPVLFWIAMGAGVLAKGPITPMVAGLTAVGLSAMTRNWRWLRGVRPVLGVVIVAAMVAPWVYAVGEQIGWQKYLSTIYDETIGRSQDAKEGHWGPPGYHVVLLCVLFWPGVLLTGAAIARALRVPSTSGRGEVGVPQGIVARLRRRIATAFAPTATTFLLAWILPSWVVFELIATKLPHYTLPMYPAVALLSARAVFGMSGIQAAIKQPMSNLSIWFWTTCGVLGQALAMIGCLLLTSQVRKPSPVDYAWLGASVIIAILVALAIIDAGRRALRGQYLQAQLLSFPVAVGIAFTFLSGPAEDWLPGARTGLLVDEMRSVSTSSSALGTTYHEDSMIFWTRGRVERIEQADIKKWFDNHPAGVALVNLDMRIGELQARGYRTGRVFMIGGKDRVVIARDHLGSR